MSLFQKMLGTNVLKSTYYYSIFVCMLVITTIYLFKKLKSKNELLRQGFPGLKLNWFNLIGHGTIVVHQLMSKGTYSANTYILQLLDGLRMLFKNENIFYIWLFNTPYIFLYKADSIGELLGSTDNIEKASKYSKLHDAVMTGLLTSTGQKWRSRRRILTPSFHFDILKHFLPIVNDKSTTLIDILREATCKESIDITKTMKMCSLDIMCESMFGFETNAQREQNSEFVKRILRGTATSMERIADPSLAVDFIFYLSKTGKQYIEDVEFFHNHSKNIFRKKKEQFKTNENSSDNGVQLKRKTFIDILMYHHMHKQDFTEEDILEELHTFTIAGFDTISSALYWILYSIGLYPEVQKKIQDELDTIFDGDNRHITADDLTDLRYLECVIKEGLRLFPSAPLIGRTITSDFMIGGRQIKSGTQCVMFLYALHRDADVFPNPEVFDPERFFPENSVGRSPFAYVPFSAGPRNCIGQRFAMMEIKVVLATVLRQFSFLSLEQRDKVLPAANLILESSCKIMVKVMHRKENRE